MGGFSREVPNFSIAQVVYCPAAGFPISTLEIQALYYLTFGVDVGAIT